MTKRALITGATGQDGRHLLDLLTNLGYEVWGMVRRSSNAGLVSEIERCYPRLKLRYGDMTDSGSIRKIISECRPDEIYNTSAQSHVRISFDIPEYTSQVNATGVIALLDAVKDMCGDCRVYQCSTSELFGSSKPPQNERTSFYPRSPYGVSKLQAYWSVINYRESYNMFASQGILFNHEGEYRSDNFVTRKITKAAAKISLGMQEGLWLGNLDARRDWGYAKDYVEAMHLILQHDEPDEFVIATGVSHSVRDFVESSFLSVGIELESNGKSGVDEILIDKLSGKEVVMINPDFYRPAEVDFLLGDCAKARDVLGWEPSTSFEELVALMVKHDLSTCLK